MGSSVYVDGNGTHHRFVLPSQSWPFTYSYDLKLELLRIGDLKPHSAVMKSDKLKFKLDTETDPFYLQSPLTAWSIQISDYVPPHPDGTVSKENQIDLSQCTRVEFRFNLVYRAKAQK